MLILNKILNLFILRNRWATTFVIASTLFLSGAVLWGLHTNLKRIEENRLLGEMTRIKSLITDRIDSHFNSLNAVRGLFAVEGEPKPKQFKLFVSGILANQHSPITSSIGYARHPPTNKQASVEHDILLYFSRSEAFLKSIGSGQDTLSVHHMEKADTSMENNHFILAVPYYGKGNFIPLTVNERKEKFKGFLYTSIRVNDFFKNIFNNSPYLNDKINLSVSTTQNGTSPTTVFTRFPDKKTALQSTAPMEDRFKIKNQEWFLRVTPNERLPTSSEVLLIWASWAAIFILIAVVLYIVKRTQTFMIEEEKRKKLLLEASHAKSNFLANMSHEIRTPLGAIVGFSDLICKEGLPPVQKKQFLQSIEKNVQHLTRIIDDVLDHSRIEAGRMPLEKNTFSLIKLLEELHASMTLEAEKNESLEFRIISVGLIPEKLFSDEMRLKQILVNLIGNSLKFTERGFVTLTVQCPSLQKQKKPYIEFLIEDTGIGIPIDVQKQLFEGFVQADASTTRRYGGTGLGLALSRQLAHLLGGKTELVRSSPGEGSLFRVQIPLDPVADQRWLKDWKEKTFSFNYEDPSLDNSHLKAPSQLNGKRILLVEDSEDNQEIFKIFLESSGALVDIIDNGIDAVHQTRRKHYDLILMDIQIPGIDGKEATRRIRAMGYHWPIVALTAHAMPHEVASCIQSGCNGQITKPVTSEQLIRETESFL